MLIKVESVAEMAGVAERAILEVLRTSTKSGSRIFRRLWSSSFKTGIWVVIASPVWR